MTPLKRDDSNPISFFSNFNGYNIYMDLYKAKQMELIVNIYLDGKCIYAYGGKPIDTIHKIIQKVCL